jgi:hypothetical protein
VRHRVESVAGGDGEAREGLLVAVLRPSDQIGIHCHFRHIGARLESDVSYGMGRVEPWATHNLV